MQLRDNAKTTLQKRKTRSLNVKAAFGIEKGSRLSLKFDSGELEENLKKKKKNLEATMVITSKENFSCTSLGVIRPHRKFLNDYNTLLFLFPEFPKAMMETLVIRELGNMKAVASFLLSRGWGSKKSLTDGLSHSINPHIDVKYFWGPDRPEYVAKLQKEQNGSYYTVFSPPHTYLIYFKNERGLIEQGQICSPHVESKKLIYPLSRPEFIKTKELLVFV